MSFNISRILMIVFLFSSLLAPRAQAMVAVEVTILENGLYRIVTRDLVTRTILSVWTQAEPWGVVAAAEGGGIGAVEGEAAAAGLGGAAAAAGVAVIVIEIGIVAYEANEITTGLETVSTSGGELTPWEEDQILKNPVLAAGVWVLDTIGL